MGFLDKFKQHTNELKDKTSEFAAEHSDKIDSGIEKAAGLASKATKGNYDGKIDNVAAKAKDAADKLGDTK